MPIEIGSQPAKPESIVCQHCKRETGRKPESLLNVPIVNDFDCPHCQKQVYSCRPEVKTYSYTYAGGAGYSDYD
jgi:hypothetical protein